MVMIGRDQALQMTPSLRRQCERTLSAWILPSILYLPTRPSLCGFSPAAAPASKALDEEVLRAYYQRLLPFRYLFQWLNHSPTPSTDFSHREFAFTLPNDAYLRYQSFPTADLFVHIPFLLLPPGTLSTPRPAPPPP